MREACSSKAKTIVGRARLESLLAKHSCSNVREGSVCQRNSFTRTALELHWDFTGLSYYWNLTRTLLETSLKSHWMSETRLEHTNSSKRLPASTAITLSYTFIGESSFWFIMQWFIVAVNKSELSNFKRKKANFYEFWRIKNQIKPPFKGDFDFLSLPYS